MKPKFNTWYIIDNNFPDFDIFWQVGNKWVAYSQSAFRKKATWFYDESDFVLEPEQRLATEKEIQEKNLSIEKAKRETIKSIMEIDNDE